MHYVRVKLHLALDKLLGKIGECPGSCFSGVQKNQGNCKIHAHPWKSNDCKNSDA